ncbi:hypothetical protein [Halorussus pelagicus]|nr:hypothetical protein [Halorussus pelagicus]
MTDTNSDTASQRGIINPEKDGVEVELEFYDETMDGVEGVSMPDPNEEQ